MAGNNVPILFAFEEILFAFDGQIVVGGSMSAIAAAIVLFTHFVRNRIKVVFRGHRLVEGGIKNRDRLGFRKRFLEGMEADQVRGGVERIERDQLGDLRFGIRGEFNGFREVFSTLDDSVSDAGDFREILDDLIFFDRREDQFDALGVVLDRQDVLMALAIEFDFENAIVVPDPIDDARTNDFLLGHLVHLIF